jgi:hypothetical protein
LRLFLITGVSAGFVVSRCTAGAHQVQTTRSRFRRYSITSIVSRI